MRSHSYLYISLIAFISLSSSAEIYKTVDKNGHAAYTDLPPANSSAKPVELQSINTVPKTEVHGYTPSPTQPNHQYPNYDLRILSPKAGTELSPEERNLQVAILSNNPLEDDLVFAYMIDGNVVLESTDLSVSLNEPPRGTHQLSVAVRNQNGDQFGESEPVSFSVFRPILKQNKTHAPQKH